MSVCEFIVVFVKTTIKSFVSELDKGEWIEKLLFMSADSVLCIAEKGKKDELIEYLEELDKQNFEENYFRLYLHQTYFCTYNRIIYS